MAKITSPTEGYTGTTRVGPYELTFEDGTAEVDDLNPGARSYLAAQGYGIDGPATPADTSTPEPADPRKVGTEQFGTTTRDAAVDPSPDDFLAPTNAGQANPHGPDVVSPGIHALQDVRPVKPGDVHVDDTATQDAAETEHADAHTSGEPLLDGADSTRPARNASTEEWRTYALSVGASEADVADASRSDLIDRYGSSEG